MLVLSKISYLTWFTVQLYKASPGGERWQGGERGVIETLSWHQCQMLLLQVDCEITA